jgi:hypothetical protein
MAADAKIDLEKVCASPSPRRFPTHPRQPGISPQNVIEIHRPALPIYQSVIEKTRGLSIRTQALGAALSRTGQQQTQPTQEQPAVVEGAR